MSTAPRRDFLRHSALLLGSGSLLAACGSDASSAEFRFGVASGDPLADRVVLWTHARRPDTTEDVGLNWQVATDASFTQIVASGRTTARAASGHTAKIDATGLTAGTAYFYRFIGETGGVSTVGRTRTLPATDVAAVKLAIFSCSLYSAGFFNAYDHALSSGADYALHLGDYLYEYGADPAEFGNSAGGTTAAALGRVAVPAKDIVSLDDYRQRYAQYRSDASLQALHARLPFITIWDDHEFANNAWTDGAENHDPATQGDWAARKAAAAQAYHEWMPIRSPDPANLLTIYRRFDFGSLLTLHMLDTRIEGRARQYDGFGDADGGYTRYGTALASGSDASHPMISPTQFSWLQDGLARSTAVWQLLGNQDIMARMWIPASVLQVATTDPAAAQAAVTAYLTAKATRAQAGAAALTPQQAALLDATLNPLLPYNLDAWDGYPLQREALLQTAVSLGKRLVTVSGDSHNAWFTHLTTLVGQRVGVEFAGSSVTSPGFESAGLGSFGPALDGRAVSGGVVDTGLGLVDDLAWADTTRRGYLLLSLNRSEVQGQYVFVDTVSSTSYTAAIGQTVTVDLSGQASFSA